MLVRRSWFKIKVSTKTSLHGLPNFVDSNLVILVVAMITWLKTGLKDSFLNWVMTSSPLHEETIYLALFEKDTEYYYLFIKIPKSEKRTEF